MTASGDFKGIVFSIVWSDPSFQHGTLSLPRVTRLSSIACQIGFTHPWLERQRSRLRPLPLQDCSLSVDLQSEPKRACLLSETNNITTFVELEHRRLRHVTHNAYSAELHKNEQTCIVAGTHMVDCLWQFGYIYLGWSG